MVTTVQCIREAKYVGLLLHLLLLDVPRLSGNKALGCSLSLISTVTSQSHNVKTLRWTNVQSSVFQGGRRTGQEQYDTTKPVAISEEEELERITSLLQRDNLIRGVGVVEFVYKLLHCTPGTGGPQKNCSLHHSVSYRKIIADYVATLLVVVSAITMWLMVFHGMIIHAIYF